MRIWTKMCHSPCRPKSIGPLPSCFLESSMAISADSLSDFTPYRTKLRIELCHKMNVKSSIVDCRSKMNSKMNVDRSPTYLKWDGYGDWGWRGWFCLLLVLLHKMKRATIKTWVCDPKRQEPSIKATILLQSVQYTCTYMMRCPSLQDGTGWPISWRTWVGLTWILTVPLSARFCLGWWKFGRSGWPAHTALEGEVGLIWVPSQNSSRICLYDT